MMKGKRTFRRWLFLLVLGPSIVVASYWGYVYEQGNFHIVSVDQVYRSRQLDKAELSHYIKTYQIKSILNLRGLNAGSDWYQEELRVAQELGVTHYDFAISANRDLSDQQLDAIVDIIRDAPKPILIHCNSGADRTGLIAALYQYTMGGRDAEEAAGQLSIFYGHFPYFWNSTVAMDRTFWHYVETHSSK